MDEKKAGENWEVAGRLRRLVGADFVFVFLCFFRALGSN
jgi:hypothetical protein